MTPSLHARLALIAILVFSQVLYAGHSVEHNSDKQPECRICLQTSASGAALTCAAFAATALQDHCPVRIDNYLAPTLPGTFALSHPSRAPPVALV